MAAHYFICRPGLKVGLDDSTPADKLSCESTKEIKRVKTREARTKESTHFEKPEENTQKRTNTKSARVTTPLAPPRHPSPPPPLLPSCPDSPPPVELSFRHGCFARSLGPPGCTSHPRVGRPRATSASPSLTFAHITACWSFHL